MKALGQVALASIDVDLSQATFDIVRPLITPSTDGEAMDVDGDDSRKSTEVYVPSSTGVRNDA